MTTPQPVRYARGSRGNFDLIVALFCALLLISNICATKLIPVGGADTEPTMLGPIQLWPLIMDGGALLFPLTYIFGDVLAEVFGMSKARRAILMGFAVSLLASVTFLVIGAAPALDPEVDGAFSLVLGFVPRIVLASLLGYLCGQFVNAWVLVRMKARAAEGSLWQRLLGSTVAGELADTLVFCLVAFGGVISAGEITNYIVVGYVWKVGVELVLLPVTYQVIKLVKKHEPDYWGGDDATPRPFPMGVAERRRAEDREELVGARRQPSAHGHGPARPAVQRHDDDVVEQASTPEAGPASTSLASTTIDDADSGEVFDVDAGPDPR